MVLESNRTNLDFEWPASADIVLLPGIPGSETARGLPGSPYPAAATDLVKILREAGLSVEYGRPRGDRALLSHKSGADFWGPIAVIAQTAAAGGAGNLLSAAILELIRPNRPERTTVHLKAGLLEEDEKTIRWFEGEGPAEAVLEGLREALGGGDDEPHN